MTALGEQRPGTPVPGTSCHNRASRKEIRKLLAAIEAAGGEVVMCRGNKSGHWKVYLNGEYIGGIPNTPGDRRSFQNDVARLRRNGLPLNSKGRYER